MNREQTVFALSQEMSSLFMILVFLFVLLVLYGLIKRLYLKSSTNTFLLRLFGTIGVPIHELSHLLFCVVFGHKITGFCLYNFKATGNLGYVKHSYNPKNFWHQIGRFFIGMAPLLGGVLFILAITEALLVNGSSFNTELVIFAKSANFGLESNFNLVELVYSVVIYFLNVIQWEGRYNSLNFIVWCLLLTSTGLYLCPSKRDIQNSIFGSGAVLLLVLSGEFLFGTETSLTLMVSQVILGSSILLLCSLVITISVFSLFLMLKLIFKRDLIPVEQQ